jgi:hypothetical protein
MSKLNEIGLKYQTDKSSIIHDYLRKYEKYLPFKQSDFLKILEIGVLNGSSLKMWKEYFYSSLVIGLDIDEECRKYEEDRIIIEIGSQNDEHFLSRVSSHYGLFDLIVDDGSHINSDVIFSFKHLFNSLNSGGVYIVEDSLTSYSPYYGGSFDGDNTIISYFKKQIDLVNFNGELNEVNPNENARKDSELLQQFIKNGKNELGINIESINFINSAIIITKR